MEILIPLLLGIGLVSLLFDNDDQEDDPKQEVQRNGTDADDVMTGTSADEVFFAKAGDDVIIPDDGNDRVFAGDGNDYIDANILAPDGNWYQSEGDKLLRGGNGHDIIIGGAGDDTLYGDLGADYLSGQFGKDTLYGGFGQDVLDTYDANEAEADRGGDSLFGGHGSDLIFLDPGDFVESGEGNDLLLMTDDVTESALSHGPALVNDYTPGEDLYYIEPSWASLDSAPSFSAVSGSGGTDIQVDGITVFHLIGIDPNDVDLNDFDGDYIT